MNRINRVTSFVISAGAILLVGATSASAQLTNFASFSPNANSLFQFVNSGAGSTFTSVGTVDGTFKFLVPSLYNDFTGATVSTPIAARLTFTSTTSAPAASATGGLGLLTQSVTSVSLGITSIDQFPTGNNLLSLTGTGNISGFSGGSNAAFQGDNRSGDAVSFSSNFLSFRRSNQQSYNFALILTDTALGLNSNQYLNSFHSVGSAAFAADSTPTPNTAAPEANTLALMVLPVALTGVLVIRRKLRGA